MAASESDRIVVACACGAKLRAPPALAGKKVKCPKCSGAIPVPSISIGSGDNGKSSQSSAAAHRPEVLAPLGSLKSSPIKSKSKAKSPVVAASVSADDGDHFLSDLAGHESEAQAEPFEMLPTVGGPCPGCGGVMASGAVVCTQCGYDTRKGKKAATKTGTGAAALGGTAAKAAGRFMIGVGFCGLGAGIGGVIWYLVGWYLEREFGWIAWGIGGLAGFGMLLGSGGPSSLGGLVAAGITVLAITGAKLAIFMALIYSVFSGDTNKAELRVAYVAACMANDRLDEQGLKPGKARDAKWEPTYDKAVAEVKAMPTHEVDALWEEFRNREDSEEEAEGISADAAESEDSADEAADSPGDDGSVSDEVEPGFLAMFFKTMFSPIDGLFFLLGLVTSYQIAARDSNSPD